MSNTQRPSRLWLTATGALAGATLLFGVSCWQISSGGGSGWQALRAFAEAAMVGGLADWFAVVALFRHPPGLPIPHTAVLRHSQERMAASPPPPASAKQKRIHGYRCCINFRNRIRLLHKPWIPCWPIWRRM